MSLKFTKYQVATAIAILFNAIGLVGILFFKTVFFEKSTPVNLLLMTALLIWTQAEKGKSFFLFFGICFIVGLGIELVGIQSGALFGNYRYGDALGYKIMGTPVILGINWFIVVYCSGTSVAIWARRFSPKTSFFVLILGGALLTVVFDWLMEPIAVRLGFWQWETNNSIPLYNYICWFIFSGLLLSLFYIIRISKLNKFALNLMIIQSLFFVVLRIFLR